MSDSYLPWSFDLNENELSTTLRFVIHNLSMRNVGAEEQDENVVTVVSEVSRAKQLM